MKTFLKENIFLFLLLGVAWSCLVLSVGHLADISIDVGREIYYPEAILKGKNLYSDLFCIYGPFSYFLNALLFKFFGVHLSVLLCAGTFSALLTVFLTYKISRLFLNELPSCAITFFVIVTGCLSSRIFNFTLPYSFGILYGLVFYLFSMYFLINFIKSKKPYAILLSAVFLGLACANKYDFFLTVIPFLAVLFKTRDFRLGAKAICAFLGAFAISYLVFFALGGTFQDLSDAFLKIKSFTKTESLKVFYITQGVYFTPRLISDWVFKILNCSILIALLAGGYFLISKAMKNFVLKRKTGFIKRIIQALIGFCLLCLGVNGAFWLSQTDYLFLTFLTAIFFIIFFKKNKFDENIFILSALLFGAKSIFGLSHVNYGVYFAGCIFISFFILTKRFDKFVQSAIITILFMASLHFCTININLLAACDYKLSTKKGTIQTAENWGRAERELIDFLENEAGKTNVMIFPEGLSLNFLSNTDADGFYSSLIPLYTEGFGENAIIDYYKKNPAKYIVFSNLEMESYGKGAICASYAFEFCAFVRSNYEEVRRITNEGKSFVIYKNNG